MSYSEQLANSLVKNAELEPGFDIEKLVKQLGGYIEYVFNPTFDAYIEKSGTGFLIVVDDSKSIRRQRFSIAHEIGHLLLHMGYLDNDVWENSPQSNSRLFRYGYDSQEREANSFAADLLMPSEQFIHIANDTIINDYYQLETIADIFKTSIESVRYRGANLGLWTL